MLLTVVVRLWEPGYKERYYRQKFGVELSDTEFRKKYEYLFLFALVHAHCWQLDQILRRRFGLGTALLLSRSMF